LRRAIFGVVFFLAALLLSFLVGGREIYNPDIANRFPWLFWPLIFGAVALLVYLFVAMRQPLRKIEAEHAP
jgi:hypothetical protein